MPHDTDVAPWHLRAVQQFVGRMTVAFWNGVAGALPRVAILLAGLYVARRFGADTFARYSLALSTIMVVGSFVGATLTTVGSKFVPELAGGRTEQLGAGFVSLSAIGVGFAIPLSLLVLVLAAPLAAAFGLQPPITSLLQIAAIVIAAVIMHGGSMGLVIGSGRFRGAALMNFVGFAAFVSSLHFLNNQMGVGGTLLALGLMYATAATLAYGTSLQKLRRDAVATDTARLATRCWSMLGFFLPTLLAAGMVSPVVWLANNLLTHGPEPLRNLAIFNAAYTWFAVASFVPAVLAQVEFVRLSQAKGAGDIGGLGHALRAFIAQNFAIMLPLTLLGGLGARFLMRLFGLDDEGATRCLQLMMAAALIAGVGNPAGLFLGVIDRMWLACVLNVVWGLLALALAFALRSHGAVGVATSFLIAYMIHFVVASTVAWRYLSRYRPKLPS